MTASHGWNAASAVATLAALAVALALVWFGAYVPISKWSDSMTAEAAAARQQLAKLQNIAKIEVSNHTQDSATQQANFRQDFLKGDQDAIVVADIQTRLRAVIVGKNCELISASALPRRESGGLVNVGLKLQMRGRITDVHQVLHTIEFGSPLIFIERADLRIDEQRGAIQDQPEPSLFAEIDVYGTKWPLPIPAATAAPPPKTPGAGAPKRP